MGPKKKRLKKRLKQDRRGARPRLATTRPSSGGLLAASYGLSGDEKRALFRQLIADFARVLRTSRTDAIDYVCVRTQRTKTRVYGWLSEGHAPIGADTLDVLRYELWLMRRGAATAPRRADTRGRRAG